jgi:hypothetical protein
MKNVRPSGLAFFISRLLWALTSDRGACSAWSRFGVAKRKLVLARVPFEAEERSDPVAGAEQIVTGHTASIHPKEGSFL